MRPQEKRVFEAFYKGSYTMLEVATLTDVRRANICRLIAKWRKTDKVYFIKKRLCTVSKSRAGMFTTNHEIFIKQKSRND